MNATIPSAQIAVVDDDAGFRSAMLLLLDAEALPAVAFDSPVAFLAEHETATFDVVISDVQMPGLSGFELIEAMDRGHRSVPVILITGRLEADLDTKAQACGAFALLRKPIEAASLLEWLHKALTDDTCNERDNPGTERVHRPD